MNGAITQSRYRPSNQIVSRCSIAKDTTGACGELGRAGGTPRLGNGGVKAGRLPPPRQHAGTISDRGVKGSSRCKHDFDNYASYCENRYFILTLDHPTAEF